VGSQIHVLLQPTILRSAVRQCHHHKWYRSFGNGSFCYWVKCRLHHRCAKRDSTIKCHKHRLCGLGLVECFCQLFYKGWVRIQDMFMQSRRIVLFCAGGYADHHNSRSGHWTSGNDNQARSFLHPSGCVLQ